MKKKKILFNWSLFQSVISWVCFSVFLSHTLLYTHTTHTCIQTDAYTYSLPHLFVITISARAALQWHLFSLSSNHSLYLQRQCLQFSVGLLNVMHWMWSPTCRILKRSYLVLSRLELLWVSDFLGVLLLPPVSPVPRGPLRQKSPGPDLLHFCFVFFSSSVVYVRQTALFCSFIKDCLSNPFAIGSFTHPALKQSCSYDCTLICSSRVRHWTNRWRWRAS